MVGDKLLPSRTEKTQSVSGGQYRTKGPLEDDCLERFRLMLDCMLAL